MRKCLAGEVHYRSSRSSGPGGQHVNKTETRVELLWELHASECLDENMKQRLARSLGKRLNARGELVMASEKYRSQHRNREEVLQRFLDLVEASMKIPKKRIPTQATRAARERRLSQKKNRGEVKRSRKKFTRGDDA